jgi:hypothetical protein
LFQIKNAFLFFLPNLKQDWPKSFETSALVVNMQHSPSNDRNRKIENKTSSSKVKPTLRKNWISFFVHQTPGTSNWILFCEKYIWNWKQQLGNKRQKNLSLAKISVEKIVLFCLESYWPVCFISSLFCATKIIFRCIK